jgi:hypothetical protein
MAVYVAKSIRPEQAISLLESACEDGALVTVKVIADMFNLDEGRVRASSALEAACWSKNLELVQWLVGRYSMTIEDLRVGSRHGALHRTIYDGHLEVLSWFVVKFNLAFSDIFPDGVLRVPSQAANKNPAMIQYLTDLKQQLE